MLKQATQRNRTNLTWFNTHRKVFKMLLNSNNAEVFRNKTRGEINEIVSSHCKTDACAEKAQARTLAHLIEVFPLQHKRQQGFSLGERATFKQ